MSEVRTVFGEPPLFDTIQIDVGVSVEWLSFRYERERVVGTFEPPTVTTFTARDGRQYVGTDMTADEIDEWEALLRGELAP